MARNTTMKQTLAYAEIKPGMRLAEALRREDGALLLPEGTVLTPRHVQLLAQWDVDRVVVVEPDAAAEPGRSGPHPAVAASPEDDAHPDLAARLIPPRFILADPDDPATDVLKSLAITRANRVLARRGPSGLILPGPPPQDCELPPLPSLPPPGPMALIGSDPKLTSLPDVFVRINEVLNDVHSTAKEAAEAIGMDTGLSAKLLRLVNSAFYGFPVKVDTLSRAVTIVGNRQLTTLALGLSVIAVFKDLPAGLVDMRSFWEHSVACGVIASSLAGPGGGVERLFVAGLLHDVGRLVLYRSLPRHAAHALALARREGILLREAERQTLGFDHATLGGMLLKHWRFPETLEKAVRHHHGGPSFMEQLLPATTHAADAVTGALGIGSSGEVYAPPLSSTAATTIDLAPDRLAEVSAAAELQVEDLLAAFLPEAD